MIADKVTSSSTTRRTTNTTASNVDLRDAYTFSADMIADKVTSSSTTRRTTNATSSSTPRRTTNTSSSSTPRRRTTSATASDGPDLQLTADQLKIIRNELRGKDSSSGESSDPVDLGDGVYLLFLPVLFWIGTYLVFKWVFDMSRTRGLLMTAVVILLHLVQAKVSFKFCSSSEPEANPYYEGLFLGSLVWGVPGLLIWGVAGYFFGLVWWLFLIPVVLYVFLIFISLDA